ncbi:MAG: hypothetical protein GX640_22625 [Fibrobacter sp.]|nr:hypothetical protein [Fibrobacter sp.]
MEFEDKNVDATPNPMTWDDYDEALWNPDGIYFPVKAGDTPMGFRNS